MHYRLVALHIRIQTAAAYEAMGKWQEAEQMLTQAILEAETDYLILPFVENYRYLKKLLLRCQKQESLFVRYLIQMGEMYEMRRECLRKEAHRPEVLAVLTDKEYEMVLLINQHQTCLLYTSITYLEMEVSSQALKYDRVNNMQFDVAVYLNISEDHISPIEHKDFEDYISSKMKMFALAKQAVVNLDADFVERALKACLLYTSRCV